MSMIRNLAHNSRTFLEAARSFWNSTSQVRDIDQSAKPQIEKLEDRVTPDVTGALAGNVLTLTHGVANDTIKIDTTTNPGFYTFTTTVNYKDGGGTIDGGAVGKVAFGTIDTINIVADPASKFSLNAGAGGTKSEFNNAPDALDIVTYTGNKNKAGNTNLNLTSNTKSTIFFDTKVVGNAGVNLVNTGGSGYHRVIFADEAAATGGTTIVAPTTTGGSVALDFSGLSAGVRVDLSTNGTLIGGYANMAVSTKLAGAAKNIQTINGSKFDDLLIGNDTIFTNLASKAPKEYAGAVSGSVKIALNGNYILGNAGTDTILGNGGNDALFSGGHNTTDNSGKGMTTPQVMDLSEATTTGGLANLDAKTINDFDNGLDNPGNRFSLYGYSTPTIDQSANTTQEILNGGKGMDLMVIDKDNNTAVFGGADDDVAITTSKGTFAPNSISGEAGNDLLFGIQGDLVSGGDGNDVMSVLNLPGVDANTITFLLGGVGDDIFSGSNGIDDMNGGAGSDQVFGGKGSDRIFGDTGNDTVVGGDGEDLVSGGLGTDTVFGDGAGTLFTDTLLLGATDLNQEPGGTPPDNIVMQEF